MKGYKAFCSDLTCRDFQYEIGKTYELEDGQRLEMCKCGFHFCEHLVDVFGYYPNEEYTRVAEIEALGDIIQEGTKYCTNRIRIVKEISQKEIEKEELKFEEWNVGRCNSGRYNTGHYNSGSLNAGDGNSGDFNAGNKNSGNHNCGFSNSGNYNSGSKNIGNYNTGKGNSGDYNTGTNNSGGHNSGHFNKGHCNSGNYNTGNFNAGIYNSGDLNSGMFNTCEPKMRAFNKECDITFREFAMGLSYSFIDLCERIYKKELIEGDEEKIRNLPNFDADIFCEITGIRL